LDEEIEDDRSVREKDSGKLNKWKNTPLYGLEHHARRKEILYSFILIYCKA
jgi:hypothetical protein